MNNSFQWLINALVIFMFVGWWAWPFVQEFTLSYEDDTIPDEVVVLNAEIDEMLVTIEPTFQTMYEQQSAEGEYDFIYLSENSNQLSNQNNYEESVESIVYVTVEGVDGWIYSGTGSILTSDGVVMTNYHVVEGGAKVVVTTSNGEHHPVTGVLAADELLDIAFLKIEAEGLHPVPIGNSDGVQVGDETLVIGHSEGFINTLSIGNVAGLRSYESQGMGTNIQITNPISSGNSGGAVLNTYGEIVAIPTWSVEYDDNIVQVQNLNFAVPVNEALELLN